MEIMLCVVMSATLICVVAVLSKLNRIEQLLRQAEPKPGQPSRPTAQ